MVMTSLRHRLRSVNRGLVLAVLVFLVAYAAVLWVKFNIPQETATTVVQGEAGEGIAVFTGPAVIAPEPDVPQAAKSRPAATVQDLLKVERPEPAAPPQRMAEANNSVIEQYDDNYDAPEEAVAPPPTEPEEDLAISGRVLTRSGTPVPGIQVTAKATYLFEQGRRKSITRGARPLRATSDNDGAYAFEHLANGEYQLSTVATGRYARALISVRAGVDFADIIVTGQQDLRVLGLVTTPGGEPLAGVVLRHAGHDATEVTTNTEGRYDFEVKLLDNARHLAVRATREGYLDQELRLDTTQPNDDNVLEFNIVMEPDSDTQLAEVVGTVKGPKGDPAAGQRIQLSSAKLRQDYRVTTDADGKFMISNVEPGDDYRLSINARGNYKDYFQKDIKVTRHGTTLGIELEARDTGVLSGQMVNLFGNPIPNFSLVLNTKEISFYNRRVIGDGSGNFEVKQAPAGELRLRTNSTPYYTVEGIQLNAGAELQVPVVLDWGYDEIRGRVVNDNGYPMAVTNISLTWAHQANGIKSTSRRTAAADEQGNFRFTQLGPGSHRLSFNVAGYKPVSVNHDVAIQGSEVVVELEAKE